MDNPLSFSGKVVIVTGGGRGVGLGITTRFLEAGAEVVICGRTRRHQIPVSTSHQFQVLHRILLPRKYYYSKQDLPQLTLFVFHQGYFIRILLRV